MSHLRTTLIGLLLAVPGPAQDPAENVDAWATELQRKRDDAEPALIEKLASAQTRAAAEGLIKAYEAMASIKMRREVVRALARFDGVAEAEQPALQHVANVAANSEDPELREAAIQGLGQSRRLGKHFLKQIVDADAPDEVRVQALRAHVALATAEDAAWYRHLWNLKQERRKDADGKVEGPELNTVRGLAFGALAGQLGEDELIEALRTERDPKIRRAAMAAMHARNLPRTSAMAEWLLERVDYPGADRAEAARILIEREGAKAATTFLALAKKRDVTPEDLRLEMARLIAGLDDDATNKKVVRLIGQGKPHENVFALHATMRVKDPKVLAAVRKELQDKEPDVRRAAAAVLAARGDRDSLPDLRALLTRPKAPVDVRIAIEAIGAIERGSSQWLAELVEMAGHADRDVRNAALDQIAQARDKRQVQTLLTALSHDDWSTRLIAIDGLAWLRDKQAVPRLIDRLPKEVGRMAKAIGNALWRLTGQPFDEDAARWKSWWEAEGATFEVISPADLEKAEQARELRRLTQRTRSGARFFGIQIESHRVIFVIDCSGSMLESVYSRTVGKRGAARIDVAKEELSRCIQNLEQGALFNVFAFSSGIDRWLKGGIADNTNENRQAALAWVERLGASGATNLYDSLKLAFQDKDVDTICVLTDGEPTAGEVIDPFRIRQDVAFWNQHRRVKIHTISIGTDLEVLEWLAKDSGGKYVQIR